MSNSVKDFSLKGLRAYLEETDWSVSECGFGPDFEPGWELSQYSPAGEDFSFGVCHNNDVVRAIKEIRDYADNFDVDEHIEMWIEARHNGVTGVPSTRELVKDAEAIQEMLNDLADGVEEWQEQAKKPALDNVISSCEEMRKSSAIDTKDARVIEER